VALVSLLSGCRDSRSAAAAIAERLPSGGIITGLLGTVDAASQHLDVQTKAGAIYHVHTPNAKITFNGAGIPLRTLRPGLPVQVRAIAMDNRTGELEATSVLTWSPGPPPTAAAVAAVSPASPPTAPSANAGSDPIRGMRVASRPLAGEARLWETRDDHGRKEGWRSRAEPPGHLNKHRHRHETEGGGSSDDDNQGSGSDGSAEDRAYWKKYGKVWKNEDPALRAYAQQLDEEGD